MEVEELKVFDVIQLRTKYKEFDDYIEYLRTDLYPQFYNGFGSKHMIECNIEGDNVFNDNLDRLLISQFGCKSQEEVILYFNW